MSATIIKSHVCNGNWVFHWTKEDWNALAYAGTWCVGGERHDMRHCPRCKSTLHVLVDEAGEPLPVLDDDAANDCAGSA